MARILTLMPLAFPLLQGCPPQSCLGGGDDCVIEPACDQLEDFTCDDPGTPAAWVVTPDDPLPGGLAATGADGDVVLTNGHVTAVIEAIDHPHYLGPAGGGLLDLVANDAPHDSLRQMIQAVGLLPTDVAAYTDLRIIEEEDGTVAVQLTGAMDDLPEVLIATRYEMRACEPGIRVRTEVVNLTEDPKSMMVADGWYWGSREQLPFTPFPGAGFEHPSFGLSTVSAALRDAPYMVAGAHVEPSASYSTVACDRDQLHGLHSDEVSLAGHSPVLVMPRDFIVYERFIGVAAGQSVAGAADIALEVREKLWDEPTATLSGTVTAPGDDQGFGSAIRAQVTISGGTAATPEEERIPWTHVVPDADGRFEVLVPAGIDLVVDVESFGLHVATAEVAAGTAAVSVEIPAAGHLTLEATLDGEPFDAMAFVEPADDATREAVTGSFLGNFSTCAPLLGHPYGGAPACNQVLVGGSTEVLIPAGTYDVYAAAGPFSTFAEAKGIVITEGGTASASLALQLLPLQPAGTLSADFHVHGGNSFDSSLPHLDRVRTFVSTQTQVIAATEHDSVYDFVAEVAALGVGDQLVVMPGTESTGHVLWPLVPDSVFPKVIGHFNFWPVEYDPRGPWKGAGWDEKVEPAGLMERHDDKGWDATTGVMQLNHPWGGFSFGRDFGWAESLGIELTEDLPTERDGSGPSMFLTSPPGARFNNSDFDSQEVMNSSNNAVFQSYRAFWFYLLNQGVPRVGTANSDSHSVSDEILGFPRNLVWTAQTVADFDAVSFNADLKGGRSIGTTGPVIEVSTSDEDGGTRFPGMDPFTPAAGASLEISVRAAPWVPVDEIRIYVNGELAETVPVDAAVADELGTTSLETSVSRPLAELLPGDRDAWIVVEAGSPLPLVADLNCDGWPDTGDNDGDGDVDADDVETAPSDPSADCLDSTGPLTGATQHPDGDPGYRYQRVVPGGYPLAFTNPLIFDRDGNGYSGVR